MPGGREEGAEIAALAGRGRRDQPALTEARRAAPLLRLEQGEHLRWLADLQPELTGAREHLVDAALVHQAAAVHDGHAGADRLHLSEHVAAEEYGAALRRQ